MCPEYYRGVVQKKYGPPIELCKVNEEPLTQDMIDRMCRSKCNTCYLYRQKHGMLQQSQNDGRGGSSSGVIVVIIIVVAVVTKVLKIW